MQFWRFAVLELKGLIKTTTVNRTLVVETCCEINQCKTLNYFIKLQFCQDEVREIERTRLEMKESGFSTAYSS